jgi:Flp pilus assembly protein CpaB
VTVFRAGAGGIAEGTQGDVLISDFDGGGALIQQSVDVIENTPPDAIQSAEELRSVLGGRVAAGPISQNGILTRAQWTQITVDVEPLSTKIASGNQAITISTSDIQGVNGFVEAGDRINMIITIDIEFDLIPIEGVPVLPDPEETPEEPDEETVTVTYTRYVLQGLNVLAAGRDVRVEEDEDLTGQIDATPATDEEQAAAEQGNSTVFTLEVTPDQAERIVYAFQNGAIWLTLVPEDFVEVETDGVTIDNLFGGDLVDTIFGEN